MITKVTTKIKATIKTIAKAIAKPAVVVPPVADRLAEGAKRLVGDGTWKWLNAYREGRDIKVVDGVSTRWGGADDGMDSGVTASGINTARFPDTLGVSLPMVGCPQTVGSPIPRVPYKTTMVTVWSHKTGLSVTVPVIDIGPAHFYRGKEIKHALDMTNATVLALGLALKEGEYDVDYRIHEVYS